MKNIKQLNISLKERIYLSFSILVLLFVVNGIITIVTLNKNRQQSQNISSVIEPSLQSLEEFEDVLVESKMYTTNWVFLRSNAEDKAALRNIHDLLYPQLKSKLLILTSQWDDKSMKDSLQNTLKNFEDLLLIEKKLMGSLQKFEDYDDPVIKLEAESVVEDELLPRTSALMSSLNKVVVSVRELRTEKNMLLERSSTALRTLITVLAFAIVGIGVLLSLYMSKAIISPINKIRRIINDLGKGITRKVDHRASSDEIGGMVHSVNHLSERLQATATFATEVGKRNFNTHFEPLSEGDTLGIALVAMRDSIKQSDTKLNEAQQIAHIGNWERVIKTNQLYMSDEMFNIMDLSPDNTDCQFDNIMQYVHPDDTEYVTNLTRKNLYMDPVPFECRIITPGGKVKHIYVETKVTLGINGDVEKAYGIIQDITKRKSDEELLRSSEMSLEIKNKELIQKNKELEQFAYVASHDLQEPLRTTASFVELMQRQYKGRLDANADKYLDYIVKASERMQVLIKDLLDFSLIGSKKQLKKIDCNTVVNRVLCDLGKAIEETHAEIKLDLLPQINGYETEIKQLFQNLIINAIKFRKKDIAPQVEISAKKNNDGWQFSIKDNGIGIEEQHKERIFIIFQRLHNRTTYEGSGIGLSHCQKIVELHGGKIWIESKLGEGSTFHFTIQKEIDKQKHNDLNIAC